MINLNNKRFLMPLITFLGINTFATDIEMNKDFYELAKKKGLNVELIEAKDAPHMELEQTKEAKEIIEKLLED